MVQLTQDAVGKVKEILDTQEPKPAVKPPLKLPHYALFMLDSTFTQLDTHSTRQLVNQPGWYESDPIWKPFARNNSLYAVTAASNVGLAFLGYKMHHSRHAIVRNLWWTPQAADAALHFAGWTHNRNALRRP